MMEPIGWYPVPEEVPPPPGPTFIPYSCSFDLKGMINEHGSDIGLVLNFKMGDKEDDPTFHFIVDPEGWYKLARDILVSIGEQFPEMRPKEWVEVKWLAEYTP